MRNTTSRVKNCSNFRPLEQGMISPYRKMSGNNCKDCVHFSSRNCGMDIADSIEPNMELFY